MTSGIIKLVALAWLVVGLSACGGGAATEGKQEGSGGSVAGLQINSRTSAEVVAYEKHVWQNLSGQDRCGACHSAGGQVPQFVDGNSINEAYAAALSFVNGVQVANLASPEESRMVTIVRGGHKPQACAGQTDDQCADEIRDYIIAWDNETKGITAQTGIQLVAPPIRGVDESKSFPTDATDFETLIHAPLLTKYCAECHTPTASNSRSPFFASNDVNASYLAAQQKMDLLNPDKSRLVLRLRDESHNCWDNCANDAQEMQDAITAFANTITPTQVNPNLIVSKALKLEPPEAIIASGGERHELNQIALWEFKTGTGNQVYDTSGVSPKMNLTLSGTYDWVGGYGVQFTNGRAKATVESSKKLLNNLRTRGEYSIEAWIIPANVVQQNKNIISYSGGPTQRNFTIAQNEYNYQFYNRMTFPPAVDADPNGDPVLTTLAADEDLQATQQHIVMNYDPVNGRRMYVNGEPTGDADANDVGGELTAWSDIFSFTLANESGISNPWQGTFRMVAIHNRILADDQIKQNFKAGVGEKFFLLFSISHIPGVPADSYIKVQAEQFDTYSYLFNNPVYVNLGNPAPAIDFAIGGMRIGINGKEAIVGQSFINLNVDRITANNQEVSRLGSVVELQQGTQADDFFLSFEILGTATNPFVVAAPGIPATPADLPAQSDIGVRTFSEVNASMSELTGVPTSNNAVFTAYTKLKQQLPSAENINAFVPANIIGISQLAFEYCDQLVEDTTLRNNFFGAPYNFAGFTDPLATAFGTFAQKEAVVNALYDRMIGIPTTELDDATVLANAPTRSQIMKELVEPTYAPGDGPGNPQTSPPTPENLFARLERSCGTGGAANDEVDCSTSTGTREFVKAMCTSVLGSAAMLVQ